MPPRAFPPRLSSTHSDHGLWPISLSARLLRDAAGEALKLPGPSVRGPTEQHRNPALHASCGRVRPFGLIVTSLFSVAAAARSSGGIAAVVVCCRARKGAI